jgi:[protein-PII] uridylyltransferase
MRRATIDECIRLSKSDMTIRTAILESRYIWGDERCSTNLLTLRRRSRQGNQPEFIQAKLEERDERHKADGNVALSRRTEHQGRQGRAARSQHAVLDREIFLPGLATVDLLVKKGVLSPREYNLFVKCEDFLWAVRCHLHFYDRARRGTARSFEVQREIADPARLQGAIRA